MEINQVVQLGKHEDDNLHEFRLKTGYEKTCHLVHALSVGTKL